MPKNFLPHTTLLVAAVAGVYLWLYSGVLEIYALQLVAILTLVYAAYHWFKPKRNNKYKIRNTVPIDISLLTAMLLLLVTETGSLTSPFFFTLYFLLFAVALIYEIQATLVLTGVLILYFLLLPSTDLADIIHLSQISALLMITPLAIFTGHQREVIVEQNQKSLALDSHIRQEETDTLTFLSLNLKSTLANALDTLSIAVPKVDGKELRKNLELLYQDLRNLYRSADELERLVDQETDQD